MLMSAEPAKCASRWKHALPSASSAISDTTFRLPQLPPATISRAAAAATNSRNAPSISAAGNQPMKPDSVTATRPAIQTSSSTISGVPCSGSRPVQFGIAVSRKPVTTAGT